jgi:hypothetical protein
MIEIFAALLTPSRISETQPNLLTSVDPKNHQIFRTSLKISGEFSNFESRHPVMHFVPYLRDIS